MQLRFRRSNGTAEHAPDLFVLVSFNIVKHKDRPVATRQLCNRIIKSDSINHMHAAWILRAQYGLIRCLALFGRLLVADTALAKVHQDLVDRQTMQPGGECRLAAKASNLTEKLNKSFLR